MRSWRAYHDGPLSPGALVTLSVDESHHILRVLRLAAGSEISLFDGRGGEWEGSLESTGRSGVQVQVGDPVTTRVEPLTRMTLLQGVCRADRLESVLQKGTEVGISEFRLVQSSSSERIRPTSSRRKRWERIVLEACKQSGRTVLPPIHGPLSLSEAIRGIDPAIGPAIVLHPGKQGVRLGAVPGISGTGPVHLLVGPESGLEEREIGQILDAGWQPAGLGPRTLRTETAGLVAAAWILGLRGDLEP